MAEDCMSRKIDIQEFSFSIMVRVMHLFYKLQGVTGKELRDGY